MTAPDTVRVKMIRNKVLGIDEHGAKVRARAGDIITLPRSRAAKWQYQRACEPVPEPKATTGARTSKATKAEDTTSESDL